MAEQAGLRVEDTSPMVAPMQQPSEASSRTASPGPDFRHLDTWVFDLDHTLYTVDRDQHTAMEERICRFVQQHLGMTRDPAWALQKRYLQDYGSTLAGLIRHHGIEPDNYHDEINDIAGLALKPAPQLRSGLARLPGQRLVFTNNCGRFARAVLDQLGIADLFFAIVAAKALDFRAKPDPAAYATLVALQGFQADRAVLFDDSARNLVPANVLGMTTVWLNNGLGQSYWRIPAPELHIDHETGNLTQFLHSIRV
jgi:putative hydrolase of the HAD superfamily